ncbi:unnamed protein product, partial [Gongylonema pulchrum]|uniref:Protein CASC5 n=1 Tax=Gongylonema pulchrum TaxID=637853 RepID=A0A183DL60_9BILA
MEHIARIAALAEEEFKHSGSFKSIQDGPTNCATQKDEVECPKPEKLSESDLEQNDSCEFAEQEFLNLKDDLVKAGSKNLSVLDLEREYKLTKEELEHIAYVAELADDPFTKFDFPHAVDNKANIVAEEKMTEVCQKSWDTKKTKEILIAMKQHETFSMEKHISDIAVNAEPHSIPKLGAAVHEDEISQEEIHKRPEQSETVLESKLTAVRALDDLSEKLRLCPHEISHVVDNEKLLGLHYPAMDKKTTEANEATDCYTSVKNFTRSNSFVASGKSSVVQSETFSVFEQSEEGSLHSSTSGPDSPSSETTETTISDAALNDGLNQDEKALSVNEKPQSIHVSEIAEVEFWKQEAGSE